MVKFTDDAAPSGGPATGDKIPLVDVSDTTDDAAGSSKTDTVDNILAVNDARTKTLTNTTIDANGTGNSISNIDVADLANGTDGELITWDATGAPAAVATGTATHVLTSNGAGAAPTFQAAAGGGGGQTLYDAVLATSGGDYTDLSTALAALTTGQTLFVRSGTYTETTLAAPADGITIVGENQETSIIQLSFGSNQSWSAVDDFKVTNCTINLTSTGRWQLTGQNPTIDNCHILLSGTVNSFALQATTGNNSSITNCWIEDTSSAADRPLSGWALFSNNRCIITNGSDTANYGWIDAGLIASNNKIAISTTPTQDGAIISNYNMVSNNYLEGGGSTTAIGIYNALIAVGNRILAIEVGVETVGSAAVSSNVIIANAGAASRAVLLSGSRNAVSGNFMQGTTSATAIEVGTSSDSNSITGNVAYSWGVGVDVTASTADNNVIMGNTFPSVTTDISDSGTGTLSTAATDSDPLNTN